MSHRLGGRLIHLKPFAFLPVTMLTVWSSTVLVLYLVLLLFVLLVVSAFWGLATLLTSWGDIELKAPPLPHPPYRLPLLGDTLQAALHSSDFYDWLTALADGFHGRPHELRVLGTPPSIYVTTPELLEDVLATQFDSFERGPFFHDLLSDVLGDSIFAVDGPAGIHQRKTASQLFTMSALREAVATSVHKQIPVLLRILQRSVDSDQPIGLAKLLNRFTIEAFAEIGFGVELNGLDAREEHPFQAAIESTQRINFWRSMRPTWYWKTLRSLNLGLERQMKKDVQVIDAMAYSTISRSLESAAKAAASPEASKAKSHHLVSLFLDNARKYEEQADAAFIRDVVVNFLVAARDTTTQALSWFFYSLSQHPEVEINIRKEIASKLPELLSGEIAPSMDQVAQLVYLEASLKETLRLHPPVPLNMKQAKRDVLLCDGTFVKAGSCIMIPSYAIGRMEHVWGPDAKQFKPERWIDTQTGKITSVSPFKFIVFGAGPRKCLGVNLALNEMKVVASCVLSRFHLELENGQHPVTHAQSMALLPESPLLMRVLPLSPSDY